MQKFLCFMLSLLIIGGCVAVGETEEDIYARDNEIIEEGVRFASRIDYDNQKYQITSGQQDLMVGVREISEQEKQRVVEKWRTSQVSESWREYKGDFIKVQMLNNSRDLREMRLIFKRGSKHDAYIDGEITDSINAVAKEVIKETCGRKAKSNTIVYNSPSVELSRATPFYDYEVISSGAAVREIGFRCIY